MYDVNEPAAVAILPFAVGKFSFESHEGDGCEACTFHAIAAVFSYHYTNF